MEQMDHTGIVKDVRDNTIFLTFDDWGRMFQSIICSMSFASIMRRDLFHHHLECEEQSESLCEPSQKMGMISLLIRIATVRWCGRRQIMAAT